MKYGSIHVHKTPVTTSGMLTVETKVEEGRRAVVKMFTYQSRTAGKKD